MSKSPPSHSAQVKKKKRFPCTNIQRFATKGDKGDKLLVNSCINKTYGTDIIMNSEFNALKQREDLGWRGMACS